MEKLESILGNLGLDDAMSAVFVCLAGKKKATMEEIYEDTILSRKAISMALDALESGGAVKRENGYFIVEDVQKALMALLPSRFEELKAEVRSYRPLPKIKECPMVEVMRDEASEVPSFTARNVDAALESVDIISRSLTWLDDQSLNSARAAVQRGVKVRVITYKHPELEADARALTDAGVEVRSHEYSKDVRFMMIDGEFIAFAIREPPQVTQPAYFGLMIRDRDVCRKMLQYIFDPAWSDSEIVEQYRI